MVAIEVSEEYGYCVLVAVLSVFMTIWKAFQVGKMRKKFKISYPTMYSNDNKLFNCYQRAHQNTLELYPVFLTLLLLGGLQHPVVSAVGGIVWTVGRVIYALGYYTGDPAKRENGAFGNIGLIAMLFCTIHFAINLLGCF